MLVLYAEHISAAQKFAARHHYDLDANQELIALGVSNLGAGLFGGFVGGGSLSKTTVNDVAGAHAGVGKEMIRTTDPRPRAILLDLEASSGLDISSADMLAELVAELKVQGIELLLATVREPIRNMLWRSGVAQTIGEEHIYPVIEEGVEDFRARFLAQD